MIKDFIRKKLVLYRTLSRNLRAREYESVPTDPKQRLSIQLERLNRCWQKIQRNVKFYRKLVKNKMAPAYFDSWGRYLSCMPVIKRKIIQKEIPELTDISRPPDFHRVTGGSTAEPIQIPAWNSEISNTDPDVWLGRKWYGIDPYDSLFLLWGHSHLLGTGFKGALNRCTRMLKDSLLGYTRFSAYDLSDEAMYEAAQSFKKAKAKYVIGYSVALDRFARVNKNIDLSCQTTLKAVIGAAEAFPFYDSVRLLADVFKTPIAMEYGSVETGLMAHTRPEGGYSVFWLSYFLEAVDKAPNGGRVLRVTSLYPRCFPLMRYEIGDEIDIQEPTFGVTSFEKVIGRCNDYLEMDAGKRIHSEAITHCVRSCAAVSGYQMVKDKDRLTLKIILQGSLSSADKKGIMERLCKIDLALGKTKIAVVNTLEQTIAGKTPVILSR